MSLREIVLWPDERLKAICEPVGCLDTGRLAADMLETMYAAKGRGLAGPQVGMLRRIFVMDAGWKAGKATPLVCLDPVVTPLGEALETREEGCLSIPGRPVEVTRPARIRLGYTDLGGAAHRLELEGVEAAIAQHEADHLDGRLIIDGLPDKTAAEGPL